LRLSTRRHLQHIPMATSFLEAEETIVCGIREGTKRARHRVLGWISQNCKVRKLELVLGID
jgi:hypothetical protein